MTLVEFLAPLKRGSRADQCLAVLYYNARYKGVASMSVSEVREALGQARISGAKSVNVADVLARSGHNVDAPETNERGHKLWQLTETGFQHVRSRLGLPEEQVEVEHDVATLTKLVASVADPVVKGYLEESITCLRVGALRATIVFMWSGAIRTLQEQALQHHALTLNAAMTKHDPKAKQVKKIEDFSAVKDSITLLACRELTLLDKGQWQTLEEALNLRNRCGHPTTYKPGIKKASSFVEDVVGIVFK